VQPTLAPRQAAAPSATKSGATPMAGRVVGALPTLRHMSRYRGGPKPWEKDDPKGRRLDPGQYPELNAMFYNADPAGFIKMRIELLSLMR